MKTTQRIVLASLLGLSRHAAVVAAALLALLRLTTLTVALIVALIAVHDTLLEWTCLMAEEPTARIKPSFASA